MVASATFAGGQPVPTIGVRTCEIGGRNAQCVAHDRSTGRSHQRSAWVAKACRLVPNVCRPCRQSGHLGGPIDDGGGIGTRGW